MTDVPGPGEVVGAPFQHGVLMEAEPAPASLSGDGLADLMAAILAVAGELELPAVLERFVQVSAELTGARYGAINVVDEQGASVTFVYTGVPTAIARMMAHPPHAQGVLGEIPDTGALRIDDLTKHPAFRGWPAHHPQLGTFLGASVRVRDQVFGQLYLSEKLDGTPFSTSDERTIVALAAAAGVAVANAQMYAQSARREHWLQAGQAITTMLLEGIDEEAALEHIARTAREVAGADTAALALPGLGGELLIELADGHDADKLLGQVMPEGGRAWTVQREGKGLLTPSLHTSRTVKVLGAGEFFTVDNLFPLVSVGLGLLCRLLNQNEYDAIGELEGGFDRVGKPRANGLAENQPVNDGLDIVFFVFIEGRSTSDVVNDTVDAGPDETFSLNVSKDFLVLAFFAAGQRGAICTFVPAGRDRISSTICEECWLVISLPQIQQWGVPVRAKRSLK